MSKKDWQLPGYQGRPNPQKAAKSFIFVIVLLILIGFIRVGLREGLFESVINFFLY